MKSEHDNKYNIFQFNIMTSLLSVLNKNDCEHSDFIVAKYLLDHIHTLNQLSIYKVADDCFVSRSSVQRFIKAIGYDSFTALKSNAGDVFVHQKSFINYTDHSDYTNYLNLQLNSMMQNINELANDEVLRKFARQLHDTPVVVLLSADDGLGSLSTFQQSLLLSKKLVRVVTNSSKSAAFLETLTEDDLIITCSVSGNYAIASLENVRKIKAKKALITINRTLLFESVYDKIFYLSKEYAPSSRTINANRNVYTRYGLSYFLDLLYHYYFAVYQDEIIRESDYEKEVLE